MLNINIIPIRRANGITEAVLKTDGISGCRIICRTNDSEPAPGCYNVSLQRCPRMGRTMPFIGQAPTVDTCRGCLDTVRLRRKQSACLAAPVVSPSASPAAPPRPTLTTLRCPMLQPGNGVFNLPQGAMVVGQPHPSRQILLESQATFLRLFDRMRKAVSRGKEVRLEMERK